MKITCSRNHRADTCKSGRGSEEREDAETQGDSGRCKFLPIAMSEAARFLKPDLRACQRKPTQLTA